MQRSAPSPVAATKCNAGTIGGDPKFGVSFGVSWNCKKSLFFAGCCIPKDRMDSLETLMWTGSCESLRFDTLYCKGTEGPLENRCTLTGTVGSNPTASA